MPVLGSLIGTVVYLLVAVLCAAIIIYEKGFPTWHTAVVALFWPITVPVGFLSHFWERS